MVWSNGRFVEAGSKEKSINRKGAQALRNSPVGYFSAVARLRGAAFRKGRKVLFISTITLRSLRSYPPELYLTPKAFAKEVA